MNKQNFKTQLYQLNNYENEQSEVIYAGNPNSKEAIVFIHCALLTYKIMTMFEPYMREYITH